MFEGNPPRQADAHSLEEERDSGALRELTWAELVSRIAASRGIRGEEFVEAGGDASFDAGFARRIAAHHNGKGFGNHDGLAHGKQPPGRGLMQRWRRLASRGSE